MMHIRDYINEQVSKNRLIIPHEELLAMNYACYRVGDLGPDGRRTIILKCLADLPISSFFYQKGYVYFDDENIATQIILSM